MPELTRPLKQKFTRRKGLLGLLGIGAAAQAAPAVLKVVPAPPITPTVVKAAEEYVLRASAQCYSSVCPTVAPSHGERVERLMQLKAEMNQQFLFGKKADS